MSETWIEFRPDHKGHFDEIVAHKPDMVHVETMDKGSCYIGFYWDDGRICQFWIHAEKGKLKYDHEHGQTQPTSSPTNQGGAASVASPGKGGR